MRTRIFLKLLLTLSLALMLTVPSGPVLSAGAGSLPSGWLPSLAVSTYHLNAKPDPVEYIQTLAPEPVHRRTARKIIAYLKERHLKKLPLDDDLSLRVFDRYVEELDQQHLFFLESDLREFAPLRLTLDDTIQRGNLDPAYRIFNRYQQRQVEHLVYLIDTVGNGLEAMDFHQEGTVEADRSDAPRPVDKAEQEAIWYRRLKNEVLNLKLAGKTLTEIQSTLDRRYQSQLNRVAQNNSEDVFRTYMNAWAGTFDPHTQYFSPRMSENFKIQMSLKLEGIGALLQSEDEHTKVVRLVPAGPAEKGKELMPGDRIVGVGQGPEGEITDVVGWRLDDVVQRIRGPKGTVVRLEILPAGMDNEYQTRIISIVRNTVKLEEQAAKKEILEIERDGRTFTLGVITVPTFYLDFQAYHEGREDYKSTTRDVRRLVAELKESGVDGIVMDLRDNGGGALQEANELTGLFIDKGPTVQIENEEGQISALYDDDGGIAYEGPLVVMVNRLSASAAEIFAGAIQDYQRGVVTGSKTYGKGTVQSLVDLGHGQLKLTFAKFYRVSGDSTQHRGIVPDILFPPVYDAEQLGESALQDAIPWSHIQPSEFIPYGDLRRYIPEMQQQHTLRTSHSADFAYLRADLAFRKESGQRKLLSLNEEQRRKRREKSESERLVLENKRRIAKGLPPLESLEEAEDDNEVANENGIGIGKTTDEPDPLLMESAYVLLDLILFSQKS